VTSIVPSSSLWRCSPGEPSGPAATELGYHDHNVVDGGKARIILDALVTPADVMENQPMLDQLGRGLFRWKLNPKRVIADTTYGTVENIVALEDLGIRAYVPLPDFDERTEYWGASHFTYDAEHDRYQFSQKEFLSRRRTKYTEGKIEYRTDADVSNACPMKAACTGSDNGRSVYRSLHEEYLDRVRAYHGTPDVREGHDQTASLGGTALCRSQAVAPSGPIPIASPHERERRRTAHCMWSEPERVATGDDRLPHPAVGHKSYGQLRSPLDGFHSG
jgi:hypothetical protein